MTIERQLWVIRREIARCSSQIKANLSFVDSDLKNGYIERAEYLFSLAENTKDRMDALVEVLESINIAAELDLIMARKQLND